MKRSSLLISVGVLHQTKVDVVSRVAAVISGRENFRRLDEVDQVMRDAALLGCGNFRGADIEAAVNLRGIANQHLPIQALGEPNRERRFAGSSGPEDDDELRKRAHPENFQ